MKHSQPILCISTGGHLSVHNLPSLKSRLEIKGAIEHFVGDLNSFIETYLDSVAFRPEPELANINCWALTTIARKDNVHDRSWFSCIKAIIIYKKLGAININCSKPEQRQYLLQYIPNENLIKNYSSIQNLKFQMSRKIHLPLFKFIFRSVVVISLCRILNFIFVNKKILHRANVSILKTVYPANWDSTKSGEVERFWGAAFPSNKFIARRPIVWLISPLWYAKDSFSLLKFFSFSKTQREKEQKFFWVDGSLSFRDLLYILKRGRQEYQEIQTELKRSLPDKNFNSINLTSIFVEMTNPARCALLYKNLFHSLAYKRTLERFKFRGMLLHYEEFLPHVRGLNAILQENNSLKCAIFQHSERLSNKLFSRFSKSAWFNASIPKNGYAPIADLFFCESENYQAYLKNCSYPGETHVVGSLRPHFNTQTVNQNSNDGQSHASRDLIFVFSLSDCDALLTLVQNVLAHVSAANRTILCPHPAMSLGNFQDKLKAKIEFNKRKNLKISYFSDIQNLGLDKKILVSGLSGLGTQLYANGYEVLFWFDELEDVPTELAHVVADYASIVTALKSRGKRRMQMLQNDLTASQFNDSLVQQLLEND